MRRLLQPLQVRQLRSEKFRRDKRKRPGLGQSYDGSVAVRHFVEVLAKDYGPAKLRKSIEKPLKGLKVACYYGCYLLRPPEVTNFDNPENPTLLESLVEAMGGKR